PERTDTSTIPIGTPDQRASTRARRNRAGSGAVRGSAARSSSRAASGSNMVFRSTRRVRRWCAVRNDRSEAIPQLHADAAAGGVEAGVAGAIAMLLVKDGGSASGEDRGAERSEVAAPAVLARRRQGEVGGPVVA